jgi:hypothetical protein
VFFCSVPRRGRCFDGGGEGDQEVSSSPYSPDLVVAAAVAANFFFLMMEKARVSPFGGGSMSGARDVRRTSAAAAMLGKVNKHTVLFFH